jgi:hypothetical protein
MNRSRRMKWAEHVARTGEVGNAYKILVGKPEGNITWENNIKMHLIEKGYQAVNFILLIQEEF